MTITPIGTDVVTEVSALNIIQVFVSDCSHSYVLLIVLGSLLSLALVCE